MENLAPVLIGSALTLALAFHRNRAAQVFAVLLAISLATASGDVRHQYGVLRFAPWLLAYACLVPEPRLISRRMGGFVIAFLLVVALTMAAPEHVFTGLTGFFAKLSFGAGAGDAACIVLVAAALLCLLRWTMVRRPMELGLALALLPAAYAASVDGAVERQWALGVSGALGIAAVLYASYRMAFIDGLSGLPNRRALDETLSRLSGNYALAMVDIDHFKQFNDTYGHDAGDRVLAHVAKVLRRRAGGAAFRYGGEEFCVVYEGARSERARDGCESARAAVDGAAVSLPATSRGKSPTKKARDKPVSVTVSIGVAARTAERKTPAQVLKAADQALYKAKAKGRNRVVPA